MHRQPLYVKAWSIVAGNGSGVDGSVARLLHAHGRPGEIVSCIVILGAKPD